MRGAFHWIDRWQQSCAYKDMTLAEQGAFRNLLDELWLRDGVLPDNDRALAKMCGDAIEWPTVKAAVMAKFYRTPEGWRNRTHDEVSKESQKRAERQARYRDKRRGGDNNVTRNVTHNEVRNVPPSPFTVRRSPDNVIPPPPREEADAVNAECQTLAAELVKALERAKSVTGRDGAEVLAHSTVRGKGSVIVNPTVCSPEARKLWRITTERVNGYIAAFEADRREAAKGKGKRVPAHDRGLDHAVSDADLAWDPRLGPAPVVRSGGDSVGLEAQNKAPAKLTVTQVPSRCPMCQGDLQSGGGVVRCLDSAGLGCDWSAGVAA